jgi:hypothetical protein
MRHLYADWDAMTAKTVSGLRAMLSLGNAEPELLETIGELTVASERFRALWSRRDVRARASGLTYSTTRWPGGWSSTTRR